MKKEIINLYIPPLTPTNSMPAFTIAFILQQNGGDGRIRFLQDNDMPITQSELDEFSKITEGWIKSQLVLQTREKSK